MHKGMGLKREMCRVRCSTDANRMDCYPTHGPDLGLRYVSQSLMDERRFSTALDGIWRINGQTSEIFLEIRESRN